MLTRLVIFLLMFFSLCFPISAEAANWVKVATGDRGDSHYVDSESIVKNSSEIMEAWVKYQYGKPQCGSNLPKCVSYIVTYLKFFPNKTYCTEEFTAYHTDKTTHSIKENCTLVSRVVPDSVVDAVRVYVSNFEKK